MPTSLSVPPKPTVTACSHDGRVLAEYKGFTVIDCAQCGYAHLHPMPALPDTPEYYEEEFYQKVYPNYIANDQADAEWLELEARTQYDEFEEFLAPGIARTLLDVGSGPGYFLRAGQQRGWTATGVEPSKMAWRFSTEQLGLSVVNGYFPSPATQALPKFAVTNCKKVLEHISDPLAFLQAMKDATVPGGLVCVSVPNEFNPLQQAFVADSGREAWWVCEEHFNYFTPDSLQRLGERAGLETVRVTTDFPMEMFLLMGEDYIGDDSRGRACHQRRKNFELALDRVGQTRLRTALYEAMARCGVGRLVTYIGRTPTSR